jgi:uncharacterized protein (TIGR02246 family)
MDNSDLKLDAEATSLDPRVQLLVDKAEIGSLLLSFGAALDSKDWEGYADTFTEGGVFEIMGQKRTGREEIAAGPARDLERYDRLQHYSTNHVIEVDGDTAKASHYLIGVHVPDGKHHSRHADVGGRYLCECRRTAAGWKLSSARIEVLWSSGEEWGIEPDGDEG